MSSEIDDRLRRQRDTLTADIRDIQSAYGGRDDVKIRDRVNELRRRRAEIVDLLEARRAARG